MRARAGRAAAAYGATMATLAALALAGFAGCEAVPDIDFEVPDATADGGTPDGQLDQGAAPNDASTDTSASETGGDGSAACALPKPFGGTCCGNVWCVGQCDQTNCDLCAAKGCVGSDLCCGRMGMGSVQCKPQCP